jgi:hypothetical protein
VEQVAEHVGTGPFPEHFRHGALSGSRHRLRR